MSMNPDRYLETAIRSASPQRLHLMLLEGAMRFGRQAFRGYYSQQPAMFSDNIIKVQEIVLEFLTSLSPEHDRELYDRARSLYLYIYRLLAAASLRRNMEDLQLALKLLDIERRAWTESLESGSKSIPTPHLNLLAVDSLAGAMNLEV